MVQEPRIPPDLRQLFDSVCDEIATQPQIEELERRLGEASVRKIYAEYCRLHVDLYFHIRARKMTARAIDTIVQKNAPSPAAPAGTAAAPVKSPVLGFLGGAIDYVNQSRTMMFWLLAMAMAGWVAFHLGSLMFDRAHPGNAQVAGGRDGSGGSRQPGGPASPSEPLAKLTGDVGCRWRIVAGGAAPDSNPAAGGAGASFEIGSQFSAGQQLDLERGLAEITFASGAKIILNGPAHFTVGSPLEARLDIGKLTARVPQAAKGFTVATPAGKVVDLGTEFGVDVAADRSMFVEVFVGEVAISSSAAAQTDDAAETLSAGHAAKIVAGKPMATVPPQPHRFINDLAPYQAVQKAQSACVSKLRSLKPVVWFRMNGQNSDRLLHDEMGGADATLFWNGSGAPFVDGPLGAALLLHGQEHDCAIVPSYPQAEHDELSVSAWVYADSRLRLGQIVSNWSNERCGQFQFGISPDGLDLAVSSTERNGQVVVAREGKQHPFPLHRWQHVAFTADGTILRLYREGGLVAVMRQAGVLYPAPVRALCIGDMTDDSARPLTRDRLFWWDGRVSEVALFNSVLSPEDIQALASATPQ